MRAQLRFMLTFSFVLSAFGLLACQDGFGETDSESDSDETEIDETEIDVETASSPIDAADSPAAGDPLDELDPSLGGETIEKPKRPRDNRTPAQKECQAMCVAAQLGCMIHALSNHQSTESCDTDYNACIAACGQTDIVH